MSRILIAFAGEFAPGVLPDYLEASGYDVELARLGSTTLSDIESFQPGLVILDGDDDLTDVLTVCRALCSHPGTAAIPVVVVAESHDEVDEIVAFKLGASDYVAKPFKLKPVVERLRSLLQRCGHSTRSRQTIGVPGLKIHRLRKLVEIAGEKLQLNSTECAILELLASRPGHPFDRREILRHCRGLCHSVSERTIDVHVRNLRAKLRDHNLIQTQRGIGYYLNSRVER